MILPGVSRAHLIRAAQELSIPVVEDAFSLEELFTANEVIVTASGALCRPVSTIDGKQVGGKAYEILEALRSKVINEFLDKTEKSTR